VDRELEVIHDQMEGTRASLADKLGLLESQVRETVTSTVDGVKDVVETVTDKVEGVVESVTGTVESVTESVADTFNITKHVEQHPWAAVGIAVTMGFVAAQVLPSGKKESAPAMGPSPSPTPLPANSFSHATGGMMNGAWEAATTGIQGLAVGGLMSFIREMVEQSLPEEWKNDVHRFVDDVTQKLGGKPLPAVKLEEESKPDSEQVYSTPPVDMQEEGRSRRESRRTVRQAVANGSP
jgi:ElaB/YqjD/DUF883 family membrane-anchored ribosome-binding protein